MSDGGCCVTLAAAFHLLVQWHIFIAYIENIDVCYDFFLAHHCFPKIYVNVREHQMILNITYDWVRVSLNMSWSPVTPQSPDGHWQFCIKRDSSLPVPSSFSRVKLNTSAHTSLS